MHLRQIIFLLTLFKKILVKKTITPGLKRYWIKKLSQFQHLKKNSNTFTVNSASPFSVKKLALWLHVVSWQELHVNQERSYLWQVSHSHPLILRFKNNRSHIYSLVVHTVHWRHSIQRLVAEFWGGVGIAALVPETTAADSDALVTELADVHQTYDFVARNHQLFDAGLDHLQCTKEATSQQEERNSFVPCLHS